MELDSRPRIPSLVAHKKKKRKTLIAQRVQQQMAQSFDHMPQHINWKKNWISTSYVKSLGNHSVSPCCRATEVERIERLWFKNVRAYSQSEIILVTDEGSLDADSEPAAIAVYESRRLLKFPRNWKTTNKELKSK
jgi:hypothetical protein